MSDFRVIVIGTSAGGLDVLRGLVRDIPRDLNAAIFIVMHMSPETSSRLPEILARESRMPVEPASDQLAIRAGRIYCCVPDRHLLVHPGYMAVVRGPRENRHRPAIDPLFRSAARAYGGRCIAVLLTGLLDDGTAGLIAVRRQGGTVVVHDPADAEFPAMPQNALRFVQPDRQVSAAEIPAALMELCGRKMPTLVTATKTTDRETAMSEMNYVPEEEHPGKPSTYVCPECSGTLWEIEEGDMMRFRCRVGHAYSPENMLEGKAEAAEASLWAALRSLEESASLSRRMAQRVSRGALRNRYLDDAQSKMDHAATLRNVLTGFREPPMAHSDEEPPADDAGAAQHSPTGTE